MRGRSTLPFLNAARSRIAASGIRGLSLRSVAQDAGTSLGALNYSIGDKAALIAQLIDEERAERRAMHGIWLERTEELDLAVPETLSAIVAAYLDEAATMRRDAALTGCELLLEAGLDPASYPGIADLLDEEEGFWSTCLARDHGVRAQAFGQAIACYCRDELPFSIAAPHDPNYRLLRAATIDRLAAGLAGSGTGLASHFETLVAACGSPQAMTPLTIDLPMGSKKAELARHIAGIITDRGVANVTHRLVAARAGVPNSSIAYHFRTRVDLLDAGMGALVLDMRQELSSGVDRDLSRRHGPAVIRATHSIALAAARDPALVPFALDMRRRRAENVRSLVGATIGGPAGLDDAATQAAILVMIGSSFAVQAHGGNDRNAFSLDRLAALRASFATA
ncbi:MAG: TetR family transcriptional regulator [Pseudomonadota bacterium]|uniref:TetR family transcriptional regulator n=1 Tax=Sphingomonas sp. ERG5 TaxID=1381597 RepID=UPI00068CF09E|nr:TetR family transcriptional regulator [Sphingomonas sp. ERG5]